MIRRWFQNLSIQRKLTWVILLTCFVALLVGGGAFVAYQFYAFKASMRQEMSILAKGAAFNLAPYVEFGAMAGSQTNILDTIRQMAVDPEDPHQRAACIYVGDDLTLWTTYPEHLPATFFPARPPAAKQVFEPDHLLVWEPIMNKEQAKQVGVFLLKVNLDKLYARFWKSVGFMGVALVVLLVMAWALSAWLRGFIAKPILDLSRTAKVVSEKQDYSVRAVKHSGDEVGDLIDSFNDMLARIEEANTELKRSHDQLEDYSQTLEQKVAQRTAELSAATNEAEQARAGAERANKAKSMFLANMSHEIRTPMNAILGYAQILRRDPDLLPQHRQAVETIEKSGDHLLAMINDILDLSKIEAGRMELRPADFDLGGLVQGLAGMFKFRCEQKGLGFSAECGARNAEFREGGAERVLVRGDEGKLRQVLINLLGNAVKFTENGCVTLRVTNVALGTSNAERRTPTVEVQPEHPASSIQHPVSSIQYRFEVIDTGLGIAPDVAADLFKPFQQSVEGMRKGGAGLGLALARRHVELMGGGLKFESAAGQGTRFHFELELPPASAGFTTRAEETVPEVVRLAPGSAVKAMVVDDVVENRQVLAQMLTSIGCQVIEAESGWQALDRAAQFQPAIVFMDIRMPGMDGLETAQRLRTRFSRAQTKIVSLTASAMAHEEEHYRRAGFDDFISKPFRFEIICDCLRRLLQVEFEYAEREASARAAARLPDLEKMRLPEGLRERLQAAAKEAGVTRLKKCIEELEALGPDGASLAETMRQAIREYDMERILAMLKQMEQSGAEIRAASERV